MPVDHVDKGMGGSARGNINTGKIDPARWLVLPFWKSPLFLRIASSSHVCHAPTARSGSSNLFDPILPLIHELANCRQSIFSAPLQAKTRRANAAAGASPCESTPPIDIHGRLIA
uniref:Uncharacterized protein n=1 Tax=Mycena chlorophos TaxID=658473 RepID=A0ABQ0LEW8_MYCCL|nr:predicted protein [Mycena chlorophos]